MTQMTSTRGRSVAEMVAIAFGAVYVLVGLIGFAITSGIGFADREGNKVLGLFEVNPLHNVVHLLIGVALLWGGMKGVDAARAVNTTVGASYLLVGVVGIFVEDSEANILALNGADHALHLGTAAILLTAGLLGARRATATTADEHSRTGTRAGTR